MATLTPFAEVLDEALEIVRRAHKEIGPDLGGSYGDLLCDNMSGSVDFLYRVASHIEVWILETDGVGECPPLPDDIATIPRRPSVAPELKCEFTRCTAPVVFEATKLFGDRKTFHTCEGHRPGGLREELPEDSPLRNAPVFYDVRRIG